MKCISSKEYKVINKCAFVFFSCCIIGWFYEFVFNFLSKGRIINSGFLYGPYLPVYGLGALLVYALLNKYRKRPVIVFCLSIFVTGTLEYFTGFWMWNLYHRRWWNYTGFFMNINGYICLASVMCFAFASLAVIYIVSPIVDILIRKMGKKESFALSVLIGTIMIIDLFLTLLFRY